jgi:hypothetical protein
MTNEFTSEPGGPAYGPSRLARLGTLAGMIWSDANYASRRLAEIRRPQRPATPLEWRQGWLGPKLVGSVLPTSSR